MMILLDVLVVLMLVPAFFVAGFAWLFSFSERTRPRRLRAALSLASTIVLLAAVYHAAIALLDNALENRDFSNVYSDCRKVWATRGLVNADASDHTAGNSIETVSLAFARGVRGTEVDVFYDPELEQYVVSHNFPYDLKDGELLSLDKLLAEVGGKHYYWLDFKHMRHLTDEQTAAAVARLEEIARRNALGKTDIYVEGAAPFHLGHFRDAGFATIFDIHPLADDHLMTPVIVNLYKAIFHFGDFSVIAMKYGEADAPVYGPRTRELLGDIPTFVYHVPDDAGLLRELSALPPVRVLLDHDHSADHYAIDSCAKQP